MRRHYTINSHTCHFHESAQGILHEVDDVLSLINLPGSSKKQLIEKWHKKLCLFKETEPESNEKASTQYLVISEKLLPAFLRDAQVQIPERSLIDIKSLASRILQERLDAIVQNHTPHLTHADSAARNEMKSASRATFVNMYGYMNWYEQQGVLSPSEISQWHRIKTLLPGINGGINERHLYAFLALAAPIWPKFSKPKKPTIAEKNNHTCACILIAIMKSHSISQAEKPILFLTAIRGIGQLYVRNKGADNNPPKP